MKTLEAYIKGLPIYNPLHKDHKSTYNKEHYIGNKDLILSEHVFESSFEQFIKDNNISEITNDTYRFYLDNNFNDPVHLDTFTGRWYSVYQDKLYESLLYSYDKDKLIKEINKICKIKNIKYINTKRKITQFTIFIDIKDLNDKNINKILELLHLYNYYWKTADYQEGSITLEPYKPEEAQKYIYDDCKGIIYTVTSAKVYNKIYNSKEITKHILKPHEINTKEQYRNGRIFFIAHTEINNVKTQIRQIINTSQIKYPILLKVDLNEYRHKLRFRIDSSSQGYNAYFTEEPIPSYCITPLNPQTLKEYNQKELNELIEKDI